MESRFNPNKNERVQEILPCALNMESRLLLGCCLLLPLLPPVLPCVPNMENRPFLAASSPLRFFLVRRTMKFSLFALCLAVRIVQRGAARSIPPFRGLSPRFGASLTPLKK